MTQGPHPLAVGLRVRPEDLDKSIRQRAAEGSLRVEFDPSEGAPGRRLFLFVEGETLRICSGGHPAAPVIGVLGVLFGAAIVASGPLGIGPLQSIPIALGGAAVVVGAAICGWFFLGTEELLVSPSEVQKHYRLPWATWAEKRVRADEAEEVVIGKVGGQKNLKAVHVTSDSDTVTFGTSLSEEQRRWVRNCVVAVISAPGPGEQGADRLTG